MDCFSQTLNPTTREESVWTRRINKQNKFCFLPSEIESASKNPPVKEYIVIYIVTQTDLSLQVWLLKKLSKGFSIQREFWLSFLLLLLQSIILVLISCYCTDTNTFHVIGMSRMNQQSTMAMTTATRTRELITIHTCTMENRHLSICTSHQHSISTILLTRVVQMVRRWIHTTNKLITWIIIMVTLWRHHITHCINRPQTTAWCLDPIMVSLHFTQFNFCH